MTSSDNSIYIKTLNARIDGIDKRLITIDRRLDSIDKTLTAVGYELRFSALDTAHLQTSVYWGFAIIAIVIALVGFVFALAPLLRDIYRDNRNQYPSEEKVQAMIDNSISKALALRLPN